MHIFPRTRHLPSRVAAAEFRLRLLDLGMQLPDLRETLKDFRLRLAEIRVALGTFRQTPKELRERLTDPRPL